MATIYKSQTVPVEGVVHVRWSSAEGAAKKAKRDLAEEHKLRPLKDVSHEAMDVPTSKGGLIDWLNEHHIKE